MKISKLHLIGKMSLQIIICILILTVFFSMLSIQVFMCRSSALNLLSVFSIIFGKLYTHPHEVALHPLLWKQKGHLNKISLVRLIIVCCTLQPSSTVWIHLSGTKPLLDAEIMHRILYCSIATKVLSLSLQLFWPSGSRVRTVATQHNSSYQPNRTDPRS